MREQKSPNWSRLEKSTHGRRPITAVDGILLAGGDLVVLRNRTATVTANEVVVLRSSDGWSSAAIADRKPHEDNYPTTATLRGNQIITVASRLFWLLSLLKDNPGGLQQQFQIYTIGTIGRAAAAEASKCIDAIF